MKDLNKMSDRELRAELRATRVLLALAHCPDRACLMGIVTGKQIGPSEWEQHECQWCDERKMLCQ